MRVSNMVKDTRGLLYPVHHSGNSVNLSHWIAVIISKRGTLLAASGATHVLAKVRSGEVR